ncbi:unnamed protein product [Amoebophrya sp. A120]|nr:unnamed protein product [Amoebophrya sp. A120]|eukprot:GSA120T00025675001.1
MFATAASSSSSSSSSVFPGTGSCAQSSCDHAGQNTAVSCGGGAPASPSGGTTAQQTLFHSPYTKYFLKRSRHRSNGSSNNSSGAQQELQFDHRRREQVPNQEIWEIFLSEKYQQLNFSPQQLQPPLASFQLIDPTRIGEGCFFRAVGAGVMGYGLGILLGGFFHSMQPVDLSYGHLSTAEQIRMSYKGFGASCKRMGRNFAKVGMVYSTTECLIEKERGCKELINAVYAGCATGGFLAFQSGPAGMATGCLGFAAFSLAIEQLMGNHA